MPDFRSRRVDLDADGRAVVRGIVPGEYTARVAGTAWPSTEGYLLDLAKDVSIGAGSGAALDVVLPIGGRVRVTVVDRRGEPVTPPWNITLKNERDRLVSGTLARLDPRGFHGSPTRPEPVETLYPVVPGRAFVVIGSGSEALARHEIEVLAGRTLEVEVPIDR